MTKITGTDLIAWGFKPSSAFTSLIKLANFMREKGDSDAIIQAALQEAAPVAPEVLPLRDVPLAYARYLQHRGDPDHDANVEATFRTMDALMRTPNLHAG